MPVNEWCAGGEGGGGGGLRNWGGYYSVNGGDGNDLCPGFLQTCLKNID